jgi:hypothetical protein
MWWRSAIAALKSNSMAQWPYLPAWQKEWIIATVEEDILVSNYLQG